MGKVDCRTSDYFNDNERFADMCNAVMFGGERIVNAEDLDEADSDMIHVAGQASKKVQADKVRKWRGHYICMLVLENQKYIDYRMVLRNMLTEALAYDKQYKVKKLKHTKLKDLQADEKMSGISKSDRFAPVVVIVVYFGIKRWDGARTLYELLDMDDKSVLEQFVTDYKMNLYDYHDYEDFSIFQTELKNVFETLKYADAKSELLQRVQRDESYSELSEETVEMIEELTHVKIKVNEEEDGIMKGNVCKAFADYRQEGVEEGIQTGIRMQKKETDRVKAKNKELKEEMREMKKGWKAEMREMEKKIDVLLKQIEELKKKTAAG